MWQLVVWPVILGVICAVALFVVFGPAIARWLKSAYETINDTLSEIKEVWRSRE